MTAISPYRLHRLRPVFERVTLADARMWRCALLRDGRVLIGVCDDPLDADRQCWLEARAGRSVEWYLAPPEDLSTWLDRQTETASAQAGIALQKIGAGDTAPREACVSLAGVRPEESPAVRLVNSTLHDALRLGASDIHLEATPKGLVVRYRLDGVLELIGEALAATSPSKRFRASRCSPNSTSRNGVFRRTAGFRCVSLVGASICACRSCRASMARKPCCAFKRRWLTARR